MFVKKMSSITEEELYYVGGGSSKKNLISLGMSKDDCYVLMQNAYEDFIKAGKVITPEIEKEIYAIVQNYEQALTPSVSLGKLNIEERNANFLSLKMTFVSHWYHEFTLPTILNVGVCGDTLLTSGNCEDKNVFLWVRDCYYQFIKSYFVSCKELPLNILMDVEKGYDSESEDNIIERINKLLDWYEEKYGISFLNTYEAIEPKECVVQIIKDVFTQWSNETVYGNSKEHPCCVKFEPMIYGNKDDYSGSGIIEVFPNSMVKDEFLASSTIYRGIFYPKMLNIRIDKEWNEYYQTSDEFEVIFPGEMDSWYSKTSTRMAKIIATKIAEVEIEKVSRVGDKESIHKFTNDIVGLRAFFVIESSKLDILHYELIPKQEHIDEANNRIELARKDDEKQNLRKMEEREGVQVEVNKEPNRTKEHNDIKELLKIYFPEEVKVGELKKGATREEMAAFLDERAMLESKYEAEVAQCCEKLKNNIVMILDSMFCVKGVQTWKNYEFVLNFLEDVASNKKLEKEMLKVVLHNDRMKSLVQNLFDNSYLVDSVSTVECFSAEGEIKDIVSAMFTELQGIWAFSDATIALIDAFLIIAKKYKSINL